MQESISTPDYSNREHAATKSVLGIDLTHLFSHLVLIFFTIVIVYPVAWMVMTSFKTPDEVVGNVWGLPTQLNTEGYVNAWEQAHMGRAILNSLIVAGGTVALVVALSSIAGYAFAKFRFRFSTVILLIFILTMQAPTPVIPSYVLFVQLKMTNSLFGLILGQGAGGLPLAIFIFQAYFRSVPSELREAAKIDGCSELEAFLRVMLPVAGPAIATVSILAFVNSWNEYFLPLLLIRSSEMQTVPLAVQVFFYAFGRTEWVDVFAALSIATVPICIVYLLLQRWFIQGLTAGAIKG